MSAATLTREERTARLADLRAREAARKIRLGLTPLMDLPLQRRIAFAIYDPGAITPRGDNYQEPLHRWQARAISFVLPKQPTRAEVLAEAADKLALEMVPESSGAGRGFMLAIRLCVRALRRMADEAATS